MRYTSYSEVIRENTETSDLPAFSVRGGVLLAKSDLYWELLEEFDQACAELLLSPEHDLVVDLTAVNFISSSFLGCLNNLVLKASRQKKRISVKVTLDVSWLFDIMGGRRNMALEVV